MRFDEATLFAYLLVFIRCSGMLLSTPIFNSSSTPLQVRIFTCMSISGALTVVVRPALGAPPDSLAGLFVAVAGEAVAGILIGSLMGLVLQTVQMAGALLDIQVGLGSSQILNPIAGVPVSVITQFKYMLAMVVFLSVNAHHLLIRALVNSYSVRPSLTAESMGSIQKGVVDLLGSMSLLAIQIAAPVLAVSLVVDAALGLVSKAVPQMQVFQVGLPAKIGAGMLALSLSLPPLVAGVSNGCDASFRLVEHIFHR